MRCSSRALPCFLSPSAASGSAVRRGLFSLGLLSLKSSATWRALLPPTPWWGSSRSQLGAGGPNQALQRTGSVCGFTLLSRFQPVVGLAGR